GLDAALADPDASLTVFAPTDDAFAAIDSAVLAEVLDNPELLEAILLYHVVGSVALSTDLEDGMEIETLLGENVTVTINGGVFINDAQVTVADLVADNGVVHVIDAVLLPPADEPFTVFDIIDGSDDHFTLSAVLELSGLDAALADPDASLTVFAPTDDAFAAIDSAVLAEVLDNPELLEAILLYHVVGSVALSTDLEDGMEIETLLGENVTVTINGGVFINDAQVTVADLIADNGVVHVIDAVLLPPADEPFTVMDVIENSDDHETLNSLLQISGLNTLLANPEAEFTVFAPTDDAFALIPEEVLDEILNDPDLLEIILAYHVVGSVALSTDLEDGMEIETLIEEPVTVTINAEGIFINNARVTFADIVADNGVVHVIDAVLIPFPAFTVADVIANSPDHNTLNAAISAAGLTETLSDPFASFTVFAPTDDAFDALPEGLLEELLDDPQGLLTDILLYHVVGAVAFSTDLEDGMEIETLLGEAVTVTINNDGVFINNAQVTFADIEADNGVVHVINAVLSPPTSTANLTEVELSLFPNPATSQLTIHLPEVLSNDSQIVISDIKGRIVQQFESNGSHLKIEVGNYLAGTYFISIFNKDYIARQVFIKQ
ncbi:MAG: T9SS C-terminal target domain-containing protein, partial [Saprospirales bacterium]